MTITDPKVYTAPWKSETKKFRKLSKEGIKTVDGWAGLMENIAPRLTMSNSSIRESGILRAVLFTNPAHVD